MIGRRMVLAGGALALAGAGPASERLTLAASDGGQVFGERVRATGRRRGTAVLFHMAGSNRGEYGPITPQLAAIGFDCIAIDQRSGGRLFGQSNETVAARGGSTGFGEALADLEGALAFARREPGPVVVFGSSYSAALVFILAARRPMDVSALLAFSPGEFIAGQSVRGAAAKVACPAYVSSASDQGEIEAARALLGAVPGKITRQGMPRHGVHGAATLREDANPGGAKENMAEVRGFLEGLKLEG